MGFRDIIIARFYKWMLVENVKDKWKSIGLVDLNWNDRDDDDFMKSIKDALELIRQHDNRRLNRILAFVEYISNEEILSGGAYRYRTKCCQIDFGRYQSAENYEILLWSLASTIIHESTHGQIMAKGIPYSPKYRERSERICINEQNRFLRHAPPEIQKELIRPFEAKEWNYAWYASRFQRTKDLFRRIQYSRKIAQQNDG